MINMKLVKYLDGIFSPYEDLQALKELKEELYSNLHEKFSDLKNQGNDDEAAYSKTVESIGDISELIENISTQKRELYQVCCHRGGIIKKTGTMARQSNFSRQSKDETIFELL